MRWNELIRVLIQYETILDCQRASPRVRNDTHFYRRRSELSAEKQEILLM